MDLCTQLRLGPSLAIYEPGFLRAVLAWHRARAPPRRGHGQAVLRRRVRLPRKDHRRPVVRPPAHRVRPARLPRHAGRHRPALVDGRHGRRHLRNPRRPALTLELGGHLHVGLEDHAGPGLREATNAELVREAADLARAVGRPVATTADTRALLGLPSATG
ncbi:3-keto-5-aminohexanoate cleavage protein [Yinghuangia aomiensis]